MNHYKGFAGAVKSVQCSPSGSEELVAACGLDRYLRVYTIHPPKLKHQVKLEFVQNTTCLAISKTRHLVYLSGSAFCTFI